MRTVIFTLAAGWACLVVPVVAQSTLAAASDAAKQVKHAWPATTADVTKSDTAKVLTNADLSGSSQTLKITTVYDRFKDYTTLDLDKMDLGRGVELHAFAVYPGSKLSFNEVATIEFSFMYSGASWNYLTYHPLALLLDDAHRLSFDLDHDGTVGSGYVLELMTTAISASQLRQIVAAHKVEGQIGLTKFTLTLPQRDGLRLLAEYVVGR